MSRSPAARARLRALVLVVAAVTAGQQPSALNAPQSVDPRPLRIAVISDLNGPYGSTAYGTSVSVAVKRIVELAPDLVISTGDMVAGQRVPHLSRAEIEKMWSAFHRVVSTPLAAAGIPLAVTPGNHDGSAYRGFDAERRIYAEQWAERRPAVEFVDDDHYPYRYAFALGTALFVSLDATTVGPLDGEQKAWLRDVLAKRGAGFDQRIVFGHLPLWPLTEGREREVVGDGELEDLLDAGGAHLYLSGHHHAFYPGQRGRLVQIGQACLGGGTRRLLGETDRAARGFTWIELLGKSASASAVVGSRLDRVLDWDSLPEALGSGASRLARADREAGWLRPLVTPARVGSVHPAKRSP